MGKLLSRGKLFSLGQSMGHAWATKFRCELKAKWFRWLRVHLQCWGCGFDLWVGKMPWRRERLPLQYSGLENPVNRGAWRATVHGVAKSWT